MPPKLQELLVKVPQEAELVRERLNEVLQRYRHVFAVKSESLGNFKTDVVKHTIDMGTRKPIKQAQRRVPMPQVDAM